MRAGNDTDDEYIAGGYHARQRLRRGHLCTDFNFIIALWGSVESLEGDPSLPRRGKESEMRLSSREDLGRSFIEEWTTMLGDYIISCILYEVELALLVSRAQRSRYTYERNPEATTPFNKVLLRDAIS